MNDNRFMTVDEAADELQMDTADVWTFLAGMGIDPMLADMDAKRHVISREAVHRALKTMRGELLADSLRRRKASHQ